MIVETKPNPNTTFIPKNPKVMKIYKYAPVSVGISINSDAGGNAGLEFQLGDDSFFFSTKFESGEFKVGLSASSFADADAKATSNTSQLNVGRLDVTANYIGNSGSIAVSSY